MKFSILFSSQAELVKYNDTNPGNELNATDLVILDWFTHFSTMKRKNGAAAMRHKIIDGKQFSMVNFHAIIEEFPFFRIDNVKTISRWFDKYVAGGLMEKKVIKGRGIGSLTFFAYTGNYDFEYDENNKEQKINPHNQEVKEIKPDDKNTYSENKETNSSPVASKKEAIEDIKDNSFENNLEETKMSFLNENREYKNVSSKALEKTEMSSPLNILPSSLKDPTTTDSLKANCNTKKLVAVDFYKYLDKLFECKTAFSSDFYSKFCYFAEKTNLSIELQYSYLEWVFVYLKDRCKTPESFDGYFYRSATQQALMLKYLNLKDSINAKSEEDKKNQEANYIVCPVCGEKHHFFQDCPKCGLTDAELKNETELKIKKNIWNLSEEIRINLQKELEEISISFMGKSFNSQNMNERENKIRQLYKKYNVA